MLARHVNVLSQYVIIRWVSKIRIIMWPKVKSMRPVKAHAQRILRKWVWLIPECVRTTVGRRHSWRDMGWHSECVVAAKARVPRAKIWIG